MIYTFQCVDCEEIAEIHASVSEHTMITERIFCQCGGRVLQVLEPSRTTFSRTGFPRNFTHEHIADSPVKLRDKKHFQEVSEQNGWTPTWFGD